MEDLPNLQRFVQPPTLKKIHDHDPNFSSILNCAPRVTACKYFRSLDSLTGAKKVEKSNNHGFKLFTVLSRREVRHG